MKNYFLLGLCAFFLAACAANAVEQNFTATPKETAGPPQPATAALSTPTVEEPIDWMSLQNPVSGLGWSGDGKYLVARANTGLYVLDAQSGVVVHPLYAYGFLEPYALDTQNQRVFAGNTIWDIATGTLIYQSDKSSILSAAFSHNGNILALAQQNRIIFINPETGQTLGEIGEIGAVWGLAFTQDDQKIYAISQHGDVRLATLESNSAIKLFRLPPNGHHAVFSPDSKLMLINLSAGGSGHKELWDVENARMLIASDTCDSDVALYTFSPDGKKFIIGPCGFNTELWDIETQQILHKFPIPEVEGWHPEWRSGAFSPDGNFLALGNDLGQIMIFDLASYNLIQTISIPFPVP
jgi:WD40 repeat protein